MKKHYYTKPVVHEKSKAIDWMLYANFMDKENEQEYQVVMYL